MAVYIADILTTTLKEANEFLFKISPVHVSVETSKIFFQIYQQSMPIYRFARIKKRFDFICL